METKSGCWLAVMRKDPNINTTSNKQTMTKKKMIASITICITVLLYSCQTHDNNKAITGQPTELSPAEKETAKKEISARIDEIIKGAKDLNVEAALKPYFNDSDFKIVNPDASVTDFKTMNNVQAESFKTLASMNFTTTKQDFIFLEKDLVMCTWTGKNEFQLKSGEKMKIEPYVGSMLFRKKDKEWKIIYAHETTAPPISIK